MRISDLEFRRVLFRSDRQGRESVVHVQGRLESNFGEVVRDAAVAGLGIARHSTWHVCEDLRAGRLQVVLPDHSIADSGIYSSDARREGKEGVSTCRSRGSASPCKKNKTIKESQT